MAGRPRKPTQHLTLVDAFKKNPQRAREEEPACHEPVGDPPERLTPSQIEAWNYLADSAVPGVLTRMDRAYLELCARALAVVWYPDGEPVQMIPLEQRLHDWKEQHELSIRGAAREIGVGVGIVRRLLQGRRGRADIDERVSKYLDRHEQAGSEDEKETKKPSARRLVAIWKEVGIMLGKLGMTPSERSKIVVPKETRKKPTYGKL